jgi:hypothetical protein
MHGYINMYALRPKTNATLVYFRELGLLVPSSSRPSKISMGIRSLVFLISRVSGRVHDRSVGALTSAPMPPDVAGC